MLAVSMYINVYCYIYCVLSVILFIYITDPKNSIQTSSNFSIYNNNLFLKTNYFLFVGSLVGIPPLLGFFSKFYLFLVILNFQNILFSLLFILCNLFLLVFYLQQLRYLNTNLKKKFLIKTSFKKNFASHFLIVCLQFINIFSVFLLPIFLENLCYYMFG
jgi:NADH:ubiquinone oxidoreductase subunit 2 (subunit N)